MIEPAKRWVWVWAVAAVVMAAGVGPESPVHANGYTSLDRSWWDRSVVDDIGGLRVRSDLPTSQARSHARNLQRKLSVIDATVGPLRPRDPGRLDVLLFRDHDTMVETMLHRFGRDVTDHGAWFQRTTDGAVLAVNLDVKPTHRRNRLVQYELMRFYVFNRFGRDLPTWVEVGLAEVFSDALIDDTRSYIGAASERRIERLQADLSEGRSILGGFFDFEAGQWLDHPMPARHDQAWAAVHLLMTERYEDRFRHALRGINEGRTASSAFDRSFDGMRQAAFEQRCREHIDRLRPDPFITAREHLESLADAMLTLHRQGVAVTSLEELRENLEELDIAPTFRRPAGLIDRRPVDDALFELPEAANRDDNDQPRLMMREPERRPASMQERRLEEENPKPYTILTRHVEPRNIRVEWIRNIEDNTFHYELTLVRR